MNYDVKYYKYNTKQFSFEKLVAELFKVNKLSNVHKLVSNVSDELFSNSNDDSTKLHSIFYNKLNNNWPEFIEMYREFIKDVIFTDTFDEKISIINHIDPLIIVDDLLEVHTNIIAKRKYNINYKNILFEGNDIDKSSIYSNNIFKANTWLEIIEFLFK